MYHKPQNRSLLNLAVAIPFLLMLIAGALLPSDGNHGILNPKSVAFLLTGASLNFYLITKRSYPVASLKLIAFACATAVFLIGWCLVSLGVGKTATETMVDQLKIFIITASVVVFTICIIKENILSYQTFVKTLIYANFTYSLAKITVLVLHMTQLVDIFTFMDKTGLRLMTMDLGTGAIRLQTSLDILSPFLLFFALQNDLLDLQLSKRFRTLYYSVTALSVLLSFSRVLIFISAFSLFLYWISASYSRFVKSTAIFMTGVLLFVGVVGVQDIAKMVEKRLFSKENTLSDDTRTYQIDALLNEYEKHPLLGTGMGGYTLEDIRDGKNLHSYEVQWVAFLMQFGIIGLILLLSALCIIAKQFLTYPPMRIKIAFLALFGSWVMAGFTNPYLISLTSGMIYALFLMTGIYLNNQKIDCIDNYHLL